MPPTPLKSYMEELSKYMDAFTSAAGKPQRLAIVGDHVYWTQGKQQELFSAPVGDAPELSTASRVIQSNSTAAAPAAAAAEEKFTKEEEMLRERLRSRTTGISSFRVRESDGAVFYTSGVDVYVYYQQGPRAGNTPVKVFDCLSTADKAHFATMGSKPNLFVEPIKVFNPTPTINHSVLTFVNNNNIYMATITEPTEEEGGEVPPLSVTIEQVTHVGDELHQCGIADYITQEEYGRYTGHYATDRHIVYSYIDASHMRPVALLSSCGSPEVPQTASAAPNYEKEVEEMPYSRVGDPNSRTTLVVYDVATKQRRLLPPSALTAAAPWVEYILRFGFKDAETLYVSVLSRDQEHYAVLSCPIAALPTIEKESDLCAVYICDAGLEEVLSFDAAAAAAALHLTVEYEQHIPFAWVECQPGAPLHHGQKFDVLCRHADETETAHYHLYARPAGSQDAWKPLTIGAWNVRAGQEQVNGSQVYFLANAEDRLKQCLYTVPLSFAHAPYSADELRRLTPLEEHVYSYCVKDDHLYYVSSTASAPAKLYACRVSAPAHRHEVAVPPWVPSVQTSTSASDAAEDPSRYFAGLPIVLPHVVTVVGRRGVPLSAAVFISPHAPADTPAPLALFIYGGPHVQLVYADDYDSICKAPVQVLLQHGISVAVVDNQMSNANGLKDFSVCKKNMGHFETDDYVDVTRYLCNPAAATTPVSGELPRSFQVDAERVAIFGWSYGGYATLLAMCQAADVFRIGFAGAPVGDWKLYDTGYTERYMGTLYEADPADGEAKRNEAYMNSTIGHYAAGFPEECNRVFIAHGLLDENVHFGHSCHVVKALIQHAKPYSMLVYPGERHGLRQNRQSRLHHDALLVKTLEEQL